MGRALGRVSGPLEFILVCTHRHLIEVTSERRQRQMQKQSTNQRHAEQDERHLRAAQSQSRNWNHKLTYSSSSSNSSRKRRSQDAGQAQVLLMQIACLEACNQLSAEPSVRVIWATTRPNSTSGPTPSLTSSGNSVVAASGLFSISAVGTAGTSQNSRCLCPELETARCILIGNWVTMWCKNSLNSDELANLLGQPPLAHWRHLAPPNTIQI